MAGSNRDYVSIVEFPVFSEWSFTRNPDVDPYAVGSGSHAIFWWRCQLGHEWEASPERRIRNGNACPYCANRKVWEGFNDLESQFPLLAEKWSDKNKLTPREVLATSKTEYLWSCANGHEWLQTPRNVTVLEKACPFCSGHRVWPGYNDLATLFPEVARQWSEVNGEPATEVLVVNSRMSAFRCELGHEWTCYLYIQIREASCPVCSDRTVAEGFNSLHFLQPTVAAELDRSISPRQDAKQILGRGNRLSFNWICAKGHREKKPVEFRINIGCWTCFRDKCGKAKIPVSSFKFLSDTWDHSVNEACPDDVSISSDSKLAWECVLGHKWTQRPWTRLSNWLGCPVCANKVIQAGTNDLLTLRPDIVQEWDYQMNSLVPTEVGVGSNKTAHFKCELSHTWVAIISNRTRGRNGGTGCPYCANREIWVGFNDLCSTHPDLAKELHPEQIRYKNCTELQFGQKEPVYWTCKLDHKWLTPPRYRRQGAHVNGCPYCGGQALLKGFNDLASARPDLAHEWNFEKNFPATPESVIRGAYATFDWTCKRGHDYLSTVKGRMAAKIGCPECVTIEMHSEYLAKFEERRPLLESEWEEAANGSTLEDAFRTSNKGEKFSWTCNNCDESFTQRFVNRISRSQGCPYCANLKIKPGVNDLASRNPILASEWDLAKNHPLRPDQVPSHTATKVWWTCESNHSFKASVAHRSNGRGCPACSTGGFNPLEHGWLYLLKHEQWGLLQIGISNVIDQRLMKHKKSGWRVLDVKGPLDGYWAMEMESDILGTLREQRVDVGNHAVGKFDGFTEAWTEELLPVSELSELFTLVYRAEALMQTESLPE